MLFYEVSQLNGLILRDILSFILGIGIEHKDLFTLDQIVDDSNSAALSLAFRTPTDLTKSTRTRHEVAACFRISDENGLQLSI